MSLRDYSGVTAVMPSKLGRGLPQLQPQHGPRATLLSPSSPNMCPQNILPVMGADYALPSWQSLASAQESSSGHGMNSSWLLPTPQNPWDDPPWATLDFSKEIHSASIFLPLPSSPSDHWKQQRKKGRGLSPS